MRGVSVDEKIKERKRKNQKPKNTFLYWEIIQ